MTTRQYGTKVFEKTSWGKKQAKAEFDLDIVKSNQASVDIANQLFSKMCDEVGFGPSKQIVEKIVSHASAIQSTYGYTGYIFMLQSVWYDICVPIEYNGAEGEFLFAKRLINKMKKECAEGTVIGKRQVIEAAYRNSLDLLDYV